MIDYISFFEKQLERVNYWLSYAETKNAAMIALNVAICAALISMSLSDRLYVIAMVGLLVSTIILMVSFFPFLANKASKKEKAKIAENYIFFGDIALIDNAKDYISNVNTCYFNGQKQNSESDKWFWILRMKSFTIVDLRAENLLLLNGRWGLTF